MLKDIKDLDTEGVSKSFISFNIFCILIQIIRKGSALDALPFVILPKKKNILLFLSHSKPLWHIPIYRTTNYIPINQ
jgi:hypothetical protein